MYEKQNFYSGQPLKASQLSAMEDGIIEAQEAVREICYEDRPAYEPITWDGKMEGREYFDFSSAAGEEPGTVYMVKISDAILTSEDFVGSSTCWSDGYIEPIEEELIAPSEISMEYGIYGTEWLCSVFDITKASIATGVTWPSTGTYIQHWPNDSYYLTKLFKTNIKPIDEKFIPRAVNLEKGEGALNSLQQIPNPEKVSINTDRGEEVPHFDFTWPKNSAYANETRAQFGATAPNSVSLCGRSGAMNPYTVAMNSKTVALGESSLATGYGTLAEGETSFSGGAGTHAKGDSAVALGNETYAEGKASMTYGGNTHAKGDCSLAGGKDTKAEGYASTSLGQQTIAKNNNQTVVGQYNDTNPIQYGFNSLFQVGCGDENSRINGFDVGQGGTILFRWNGEYYVLQSMFSIMNNYINMMNNTENQDYFADAKASLAEV